MLEGDRKRAQEMYSELVDSVAAGTRERKYLTHLFPKSEIMFDKFFNEVLDPNRGLSKDI